MPKAYELLREGRGDELWQMCCGYIDLDINGFMEIQERLLLKQLDLLNKCELGRKIMRGAKPKTMEEFRQMAPITSYKDYCPDLLEKREDILPMKPAFWVHTSGRSGEYPCKWVPMTDEYAHELSARLFGVGTFSGCKGRGDTSNLPKKISVVYTVAPKPYISGTFADLLMRQWPVNYLPPLDEAQNLPFEERIKLGFKQAMTEGFDYFFGISLVLASVGEKIRDSAGKTSIRPYMDSPKALYRLLKGKLICTMAGRSLLPRDLWNIRGIIGSGIDSWVYKDKIKELWGKQPLDLYSCTEGGVIASQTWDYNNMTFIPSLNFFEFIPEEEQIKYQMDSSYIPATLLLSEVEAGESYEIVITNFHGGAMIRYRIGDIIRITSLENEKLGIKIPQMAFERRDTGIIDFVAVRFTEKNIWQAIESAGIPYTDWIAYKIPGEPVLHILVEPKGDCSGREKDLSVKIQKIMINSGKNSYQSSGINEDWRDSLDFSIDVSFLSPGTFEKYTAQKQSEGADIAHIKPPHINPPHKDLALLGINIEDNIVVS